MNKNHDELGRFTFGDGGEGRNTAGDQIKAAIFNAATDKPIYTWRDESNLKLDTQNRMLDEVGDYQRQGSRTFVASTDSPNLKGGQRHFVDISNRDQTTEYDQATDMYHKLNKIAGSIQKDYKGSQVYVSKEESPNMGTRVFIDVKLPM